MLRGVSSWRVQEQILITLKEDDWVNNEGVKSKSLRKKLNEQMNICSIFEKKNTLRNI
jgi:hypothetical protein